MSRCAKAANGPCWTCGCDGTPGFKESCFNPENYMCHDEYRGERKCWQCDSLKTDTLSFDKTLNYCTEHKPTHEDRKRGGYIISNQKGDFSIYPNGNVRFKKI